MQKTVSLALLLSLSTMALACGPADATSSGPLEPQADGVDEEATIPEVQGDDLSPQAASGSNCTVTKDSSGFFERSSTQGPYVAYVPARYSHSAPMRVIVGLHGCGDTARNFASWGVNPYPTRATQTHIGISVGGETGGSKCWNVSGADDAKIMAAVDDLARCYWLDRKKITIAGYSSGGQLAYRVGMLQSTKLAGILIENSGLYAAGNKDNALLWAAVRRIPIAHRLHQGDTVFPADRVRADWATLRAWRFPLTTSEIAGGHDGTSTDWAEWLIPQSQAWSLP